ncbi:hypothetical protein [Polynucleobacter ibericus]|uniref:hypothetical protein n=1 Tax=Polynucleobacter ibericus TaxID=1819725 RepID=UPI001BFE22AE|nr:hypothetical protein [Polynucleobacter ibericus]QWE09177.1 hypothetical protein AOC20_02885 [Polynucleobacter ibericus]
MKKIIAFTFCAFAGSSVLAALPPLTPEQAEAAALTKAKAAYGDRVGAYKLCLSQNKVADQFRVPGTPAPGACTAPPPFVPPGAVAAAPAAAPAAK